MKYLRKLPLFLVAMLMGFMPLAYSIDVDADPLGSFTSYSLSSVGEVVAEAVDGSLWATPSPGQLGIVKILKSGSTTTYNTPAIRCWNIAPAQSGGVWCQDDYKINRVTSQGQITSYEKPQSLWGGTRGIVEAPDGNIWFGVGDGNPANSKIGRMTQSGTFLSSYTINGRYPTGLVSDPTNNVVWYSVRPVDSNDPWKIGKLSMDGTQTEFALPVSGLGANSIALGPDGNTWFVSGPGKIGKVMPSGDFTIYDLGYSSTSGLLRITVGLDGYIWATRKGKTVARISTNGLATTYTIYSPNTPHAENAMGLISGRDGSIWVLGNAPKQIIKVGTGYTDNDEDGLEYSQEVAQGTLDNDSDTDEDGLSDYIESTYYPERDQVFCDEDVVICEYPDPTSKDIYIENDWMVKPGQEGYSMQLNSGQVSPLITTFADKDIALHIDTGQLGGGTQVPYTSEIYFASQAGTTDFYDYKLGGDGIAPQMSPLRKDIFHYLLTGQKYSEAPNSSGVSYAGDDDFFVSYGNLKESLAPSLLDTAISGTAMHELGHNLCLSDENQGNPAYTDQPAECRFAGVDTTYSLLYGSVMNYTYQLDMVDYSNGVNGAPDDHDDWGTIRLADFTKSLAGDIAQGVKVKKNPTFKHRVYKKRDSRHERPIIGPDIASLKANWR